MFEALKRTASQLDSHSVLEISYSYRTSWKGYCRYLKRCGSSHVNNEKHIPMNIYDTAFSPFDNWLVVMALFLLNMASYRGITWPCPHFSPFLTYLTVSWPRLPRHPVTIFMGFIPFAFLFHFWRVILSEWTYSLMIRSTLFQAQIWTFLWLEILT